MNNRTNTDEITLKELILKLIEFKNEILRNWLWVLLIALPLAGYMYYKAANTKVSFIAELTFMLSDDDSGGGSGMAGILGQFGLGGGGGGKSNPEKMLELLMTRKISEKVLFHKVKVGGKEDFLANHLISNLESNEKWAHKSWFQSLLSSRVSSLKNFRFTDNDISNFSRTELKAMKRLYAFLAGRSAMVKHSFSETTGIMGLKIVTTNEALSIHILDKMYVELSDFYYTKTIEKTETNYKLIKAKKDSLFILLSTKEYQLANNKDSNRGMIMMKDRVSEGRISRDIRMLSMAYAESVKNLEIAEFSYNLKKPYIQVIDKPIAPLSATRPMKLIEGVKGLIIGFFLSFFFIILRKILRDVME